MFGVRRANEADAKGLLAVDSQAGSGDAERVDYLIRAVHEDVCLAAIDAGIICGFVVLKPRHFFERDFIDLVMVSERYRRRGLGRLLMRSAVEAARSADVFTSTNESNSPMRALLESEGWSVSGKLDGLDEGDPQLIFYLRRSRSRWSGTSK